MEKEILPTKWFTTRQISTWIGEPLSTEGKQPEELEGGHGKLIILHQCGENKEELKAQLRVFISGLDNGFDWFAC